MLIFSLEDYFCVGIGFVSCNRNILQKMQKKVEGQRWKGAITNVYGFEPPGLGVVGDAALAN